jgi:hypothetical protein
MLYWRLLDYLTAYYQTGSLHIALREGRGMKEEFQRKLEKEIMDYFKVSTTPTYLPNGWRMSHFSCPRFEICILRIQVHSVTIKLICSLNNSVLKTE